MPNIHTPPVAPERELVHPLERLKGTIRRFITFDVILFVLLFLSFWFWIGLGIDYGVFKAFGLDFAQHVTPLFRIGILGLLTLILLVMVFLRVRSLLATELSFGSLALVLEKRFPKVLGDRLITAIEMADVEKAAQQGYSADLVRHTITEARERIAQVNVDSVFNWRRLWIKGIVLVLVSVVGLVVALGAHTLSNKMFDGPRAGNKFLDVASIWGERNLLIWNTPWPRRSFIQIVDFDDEGHPGELRVGKGAAIPPKVSARAYKWVVVDRTSPDGWRPLRVEDLPVRCNLTVPKQLSVSAETTIDDLELQQGQDPAVQDLLAQLDTVTNDLKNTRKVRKLIVPSEMTLRYDGIQTKARMTITLNRDATGKYTNDVAGLGESVRFVVSAEDFTTARRQITLVPPPTLVDLYRDEFQPAYLHHPAPSLSEQEKSPTGPLAKDNPLAVQNPQYFLRGLKQKFAGKKISISSDKSVFSVPVGTELEIVAQADKPLKRVELKPVSQNVKPDALKVPNRGEFDTFRITFGADNPIRQVERATEFQLVMTDTDNVSSTRTIAIQATDDAPPVVDVVVDPIIRRVGGYLYVTPVARIPFLPDSRISDDTGLSSVRFEYKKLEEEAASLVAARAMTAASLNALAASPISHWGMPYTVGSNAALFDRYFGSTIPQKDSTGNEKLPGWTIERYDSAVRQRNLDRKPDTLARLRQIVNEALPPNVAPGVVKSVTLSDPLGDAFDLEPLGLKQPKEGEVQQRYKVELFIVAKDVNVELTEKNGAPAEPKMSKNLDPIRILVVSEQDLLAEIAKDEEQQVTKMEDTYKKANDGQVKLSKEMALLVNPDANQILSSQVRAMDIIQDVSKARDLLTAMRTEDEKLYRELDMNRCSPIVMKKYVNEEKKDGYLDIEKRIFDESLPKLEQSLGAFQGALSAGRKPSDEEMITARNDFLKFLADLQFLQAQRGLGQDMNKVRAELQAIIKQQELLGSAILAAFREIQTGLYRPMVSVPRVVQVGIGKTATAEITVEWRLYPKDEAFIAIETPTESELKVVKEMTVKAANGEEVTKVKLEITAGTKAGIYSVKLYPGPFDADHKVKPIELAVEVTK
jgi:hypothetical protein